MGNTNVESVAGATSGVPPASMKAYSNANFEENASKTMSLINDYLETLPSRKVNPRSDLKPGDIKKLFEDECT